MSPENRLKPCPFCGSENIEEVKSSLMREGKYYAQAGCLDCGAMGPEKLCYPGVDFGSRKLLPSTEGWNLRK